MNELEIIQYPQMQGLHIFVNTVSYRSPHFHHEWELLWVVDAPLKVVWQQQEYMLQPGDLALFPPKIPHLSLTVISCHWELLPRTSS